MNDWVLFGLLALLLGYRGLLAITFWRIPRTLAAERFFGFRVEATAVRPLLRRYRALLCAGYGSDGCCAVTAFCWGGLVGLVLEPSVSAIVMRVYHSFVGIHIVRKVKWLAVEHSWKPIQSVALSLQTRRGARNSSPAAGTRTTFTALLTARRHLPPAASLTALCVPR